MIIEKVGDGAKFPKCPVCKVPLYLESKEFTNSQNAQQKIWDACDHVMELGDRLHPVCAKCGFGYNVQLIPMARLMRCPKCADLYHVEGK